MTQRFPFSSGMIAAILTGLLALPATGQEFCGGAASGGQWIGGDPQTSDITTANAYREQMALVLSGNTYVALFSLSAATDVRIEAAGRGNGDPSIELFDNDGTSLLADDDSGGNGAARAETALQPGSYCVLLTSYDGSPMTAFLRVGRISQEPLTKGIVAPPSSADDSDVTDARIDTTTGCAEATSLGSLDAPLTATASAQDSPFWRFTLDAATPVTITAENETADPTITLRGPDGGVLAENDDYNGLNSRVDMSVPLIPGDYCVGIGAISDETVPITVTVSPYDPQAAFAELYNAGEALPPLDGSVAVTDLGRLAGRLREDVRARNNASWFRFELPGAGIIAVEAIGAGNSVDPWIAIYDDLGRQLGLSDDAGDGLDSQLILRANAGVYLVAVKQIGAGEGLVRLLVEHFIPAP